MNPALHRVAAGANRQGLRESAVRGSGHLFQFVQLGNIALPTLGVTPRRGINRRPPQPDALRRYRWGPGAPSPGWGVPRPPSTIQPGFGHRFWLGTRLRRPLSAPVLD